ncbi:hypothetical protein QG37_03308 [Candidozyma auris]|uniref:Uncharacterized protein n=1 Tax=Candidozyma auris TaxID=498019 RepID=A0A0L0P0T0_CANAR|nr:hypothetical protein QG37_03308 [[Candida] auris]
MKVFTETSKTPSSWMVKSCKSTAEDSSQWESARDRNQDEPEIHQFSNALFWFGYAYVTE